MVNEGIVLGHKVSERGIEVDKAKVDAIEKMPCPKDIKGIRSFLGHAGFYRRFIKDYSKISRHLTNLLQKDIPFVFDDDCVEAFEILKKALISAPIVRPPDWNLPFEIMCDTSDFAVGVVLGQRVDKKLNVIHYASKTLDAAQKNYATTEKQFLAVVFACDKFRPYIVDSKVTIHTDHAATKYLMLSRGLLDGCCFYKNLICILYIGRVLKILLHIICLDWKIFLMILFMLMIVFQM